MPSPATTRGPKRVGLAVYRRLTLGPAHHDRLVELVNEAAPPGDRRLDAESAVGFLTSLDDDPVDLIYFMSHADARRGH